MRNLWWSSGAGTGFSPGILIFPCQYHSTTAPYSSSSICCAYQKDKRANLGTFKKKQSSSRYQRSC